MDRRSFVTLLTAGAAGQAITPAAAQTRAAATTIRAVVVGGGMSGATCAKYLAMWGARSGIDIAVTLVEASARYPSCIMSNGVLVGERTMAQQYYDYDALSANHGVRVVTASVARVDPDAQVVTLDTGLELGYDRLVLAPGIQFDYSQIAINGTGMSAAQAREQVPHAWKAGPQTEALRDQIQGIRSGQHVVVTVPRSPYRCPPGPYERVCAIADWLGRNRSGSRVIVLDENAGITAERVNFGRAFTQTHLNIDYYPNAVIDSVDFDAGALSAKTVTMRTPVTKTNPVTGATSGGPVGSFQAAVVNYIAPHKAGQVVIDALGSVAGGLADGRWAVIDELTYETRVPRIHVVGDAIASKQPKAGHIGNQQGKVCADAILRLETGNDPFSAPVTNSACYTPITRDTASWLTAVFAYNAAAGEMQVSPPGVVESPDGATRANFEAMQHWFAALMSDTFG
ncbi:MAG: FAD-dependent oxidoreductase [Rhodobacter sp.]|nr:FAD-dependent oxidoreductase [Rhodobacter sp.]